MSQTISTVFVQLAVIILPMLGITVGSDQLTNAVQTAVLIATGLFLWYHRWSKGDVTVVGSRKG